MAAETARQTQQVFVEESMSVLVMQNWSAKFQFRNMSFENDCAGGPQPATKNGRLKQMVEQNLRITVKEHADELDAPKSTAGDHLKAIGKVRNLDKWVLHDLTDAKKKQRIAWISAIRYSADNVMKTF